MPPLEMSLKPWSIPFPMDPIIRVPPKHNVEHHVETRMKFHEAPIFRPPWFKKDQFPVTHPKANESLVPPRRQVKFVSVVTINSVLHLRDYSPDEIANTWYSKREIRGLKQQSKHEAIQVNSSSIAHDNDQAATDSHVLMDSTNHVNNGYNIGTEPTSTMRGLESKTCMGSLRKKRHRIQAWKAVFLEQRRQHIEGFFDPETLADVYYEVSEPCHVAANMVAMRDARDVQFQYMDDEWKDPAEVEKENQPNFPRWNLANNVPPPPPPLVGGRYRTMIALHNHRTRRGQPSLTVEVA